MSFSIQNYAPQNPRRTTTPAQRPVMRDLKIQPVGEKSMLDQPMTLLTADAKAPGGIDGQPGGRADRRSHGGQQHDHVPLQEQGRADAGRGRRLRVERPQVPRRRADRAECGSRELEPMLKDLGLSAWAVAAAPTVKTHDLDIPRIGYVHSWSRTQDEGWVRAALDTFAVPYTYFADQKLKEGNLRWKPHVIVFRMSAAPPQSQVNGTPVVGNAPLPYKKTADTPISATSIRATTPQRHGYAKACRARELRAGGRHARHRGLDGDDLPSTRSPTRSPSRSRAPACADRFCARASPTGEPGGLRFHRYRTPPALPIRRRAERLQRIGRPARRSWRRWTRRTRRTGLARTSRRRGAAAGSAASAATTLQPRALGTSAGRRSERVPPDGGEAARRSRARAASSCRFQRTQRGAAVGTLANGEASRTPAAPSTSRSAKATSSCPLRPFWRWQAQGRPTARLQHDHELERFSTPESSGRPARARRLKR